MHHATRTPTCHTFEQHSTYSIIRQRYKKEEEKKQVLKTKIANQDRLTCCKPVGNRGVEERSGSGGKKLGRTWKKSGTFKNGYFSRSYEESVTKIEESCFYGCTF